MCFFGPKLLDDDDDENDDHHCDFMNHHIQFNPLSYEYFSLSSIRYTFCVPNDSIQSAIHL